MSFLLKILFGPDKEEPAFPSASDLASHLCQALSNAQSQLKVFARIEESMRTRKDDELLWKMGEELKFVTKNCEICNYNAQMNILRDIQKSIEKGALSIIFAQWVQQINDLFQSQSHRLNVAAGLKDGRNNMPQFLKNQVYILADKVMWRYCARLYSPFIKKTHSKAKEKTGSPSMKKTDSKVWEQSEPEVREQFSRFLCSCIVHNNRFLYVFTSFIGMKVAEMMPRSKAMEARAGESFSKFLATNLKIKGSHCQIFESTLKSLRAFSEEFAPGKKLEFISNLTGNLQKDIQRQQIKQHGKSQKWEGQPLTQELLSYLLLLCYPETSAHLDYVETVIVCTDYCSHKREQKEYQQILKEYCILQTHLNPSNCWNNIEILQNAINGVKVISKEAE